MFYHCRIKTVRDRPSGDGFDDRAHLQDFNDLLVLLNIGGHLVFRIYYLNPIE